MAAKKQGRLRLIFTNYLYEYFPFMELRATGQIRSKRFWQTLVIVILFISVFLSTPLYAFDFSSWDVILKNNTRPSNHAGIGYTGFDYAAILNSREFDKLIGDLESFPLEELHERDEMLAFWINVYNIFAVRLVRDHYPVTSIKDAGSIFSPVWSKPAGKVGGKIYTLDDIENKILRPMNEPAIHFAIVCASISCPDLRPEAYTALALEKQLKSQTNRFFENREKGMRVNREKRTVHLSKLFDWYEKDFAGGGGPIVFLNSELSDNKKIPSSYAIQYLPYNWDLNTVR